MKKPIIGITAGVLKNSGGMFPGYRRTYANEDYVTSVIKNEGIPLLLPMNAEKEVIQQQISLIDGLILTGGYDIDPLGYGQEPEQKLGELLPERDKFEYEVLRLAKENEIPILGICRGAQLINVYHGGDLYQDLSYRPGKTLRHWQSHNPEQVTHSIDVTKGSKLEAIMGNETLVVNSFHHQTINTVAGGFTVSAKAKDGVTEAIESTTYPFLVGVQWHPEMLHESTPEMNLIFRALVNKANEDKK